MGRYKTVFTTERSEWHQQRALSGAPNMLEITMLAQSSRETVRPYLADAEYIVSERSGIIDADMIAAAPKLKLILRLGSMTHDIDLEAARNAGVIVCYWPDRGVIYVAEHTMLLMLALGKRLPGQQRITSSPDDAWNSGAFTDENTFSYNWSNFQNVSGLWQKTVGILGFGEIGMELSRRLQGWQCNVLYNKRRRLPAAVERSCNLTYAERDDVLRQSDYLVVLLPYAQQTANSLDSAALSTLKDGAFVISTGSGGILVQPDLAEAIRSGKVAGAALDTFDWEPLRPDDPLVRLAQQGHNVVLTPHIAAGSGSASSDDQSRASDFTNIVNHLTGKPIENRLV